MDGFRTLITKNVFASRLIHQWLIHQFEQLIHLQMLLCHLPNVDWPVVDSPIMTVDSLVEVDFPNINSQSMVVDSPIENNLPKRICQNIDSPVVDSPVQTVYLPTDVDLPNAYLPVVDLPFMTVEVTIYRS